jgi:hypothetical protein
MELVTMRHLIGEAMPELAHMCAGAARAAASARGRYQAFGARSNTNRMPEATITVTVGGIQARTQRPLLGRSGHDQQRRSCGSHTDCPIMRG